MSDLVAKCLEYTRGIVFRESFPTFVRRIYVFVGIQRGLFLYQPVVFRKRLLHGYYIDNWIERKTNRELLRKARASLQYDLNDKPLVSVIIPTYNRGKILTERAIPSVLRQTYQNFELIVVGDNCTDNTETFVKKFNDKRIKFFNLPKRGDYPVNPLYRWMVAGSVPRNRGLELASGAWIAPLDDDDEFSDDHLELLLNHALQNQYDMVYGILQMEVEPGKWVNRGSYPLMYERVCHSAVLYNSVLKFLKYDANAWKYLEPDDWNLWRRMKEAGAKIGFLDRIIGKHFQEHKRAVCRIDRLRPRVEEI